MAINYNDLLEKIKAAGDITILSTDNDQRFTEAQEILAELVPNLKYELVCEEYAKSYEGKQELLDLYVELRAGKEEAKDLEAKMDDPNIFANLLVKAGKAHGIVSGATHPTADILRPAFQIIKPAVNGEVISSLMWMNKEGAEDIFMADISVMPDPTAEELAQIAKQSAKTVEGVFGIRPVVAMLSFSTKGSGGKHPDVLKVQEATKLVEESGITVYGEIQWDAATRPEIFESKVGVKADQMPNVFIFPNLNSGNIGYKIASTLGGYNAVGPILQNISSPVNDLSRGCSPKEIADLVVLTALQHINK